MPYRTAPTPGDVLLLAVEGRVADLALLLPFLPARTSALGDDAGRAAHAILQRATPEDIGWLERHRPVRREWGSPHPSWDALQPADLGDGVPDVAGHAAVVALASFHPNGHVRERAVRLLALRGDGGELPYLLVRLNDWVAPVRVAAGYAVHARLQEAYAPSFVRCITLVDDLRGTRRAPHRTLTDAIEAFLCHADAALPALDEALRSGTAAQRRACARIAVVRGTPSLLAHAATNRDPVTATTAARAIVATWTKEALREVLPRLLRGPPRVRCLALGAMCAHFPDESEPHLHRALLDDVCSVREEARFLWSTAGMAPLDFAAFYRTSLAHAKGRAFATALQALAETGEEADAPLFEPHLRDPRAAVRAAAVTGLGRCGLARYGDALLAAMEDPSLRVRAVARVWVRMRLGRAYVRRAPAR